MSMKYVNIYRFPLFAKQNSTTDAMTSHFQ